MIEIGDKVKLSLQYKKKMCGSDSFDRKFLVNHMSLVGVVIKSSCRTIDKYTVLTVRWPNGHLSYLFSHKLGKAG